MIRADWHIHSNYSDGVLNPKQIVDYGLMAGLDYMSITDHDTIKGVDETIVYAKEKGIMVVSGIEFSTEVNKEEVHILGYGLDYKAEELENVLQKVRQARDGRVHNIIKKLNKCNIDISMEDVEKHSEADSVGRPHIARALMEKGYVKTVKEAFDKYLGIDKYAYVERLKLEPQFIIKLINDLGGVSILAHPGYIKNSTIIKQVLAMDIDGIEVYHKNHRYETIKKLERIANSHNLLVTGGTDFHDAEAFGKVYIGSVIIPEKHIKSFIKRVV